MQLSFRQKVVHLWTAGGALKFLALAGGSSRGTTELLSASRRRLFSSQQRNGVSFRSRRKPRLFSRERSSPSRYAASFPNRATFLSRSATAFPNRTKFPFATCGSLSHDNNTNTNFPPSAGGSFSQLLRGFARLRSSLHELNETGKNESNV